MFLKKRIDNLLYKQENILVINNDSKLHIILFRKLNFSDLKFKISDKKSPKNYMKDIKSDIYKK